jgi:hypothetical protein
VAHLNTGQTKPKKENKTVKKSLFIGVIFCMNIRLLLAMSPAKEYLFVHNLTDGDILVNMEFWEKPLKLVGWLIQQMAILLVHVCTLKPEVFLLVVLLIQERLHRSREAVK